MRRVTVAPITTTVKGLSTEVPIGRPDGLDQDCVISCENIITIDKGALGRQLGFLFDHQETALARAIVNAFALQVSDVD
jgi:mRNA interferase MazF